VTERAYCRVYYSIKDDPKFESIFDDDRHLATWLRLLIAADAIWPASPDLPASARKQSVAALVAAKLVDLKSGGRYRIHGLDAERGARSQNARASAAHRTHSERSANADRTLTSRARRAEPSQDEPSPANASASDPVVIYANLTGRWPAPGAVNWIDRLSERFGDIEVVKAVGEASKTAGRGEIIGAAEALLEQQGRELQKAEKKAEAEKVQARRLDGMHARRVEWYRNTGKWDPAWGEAPAA